MGDAPVAWRFRPEVTDPKQRGSCMQVGIAGRCRPKRECGFGLRATGARVTGYLGSVLIGSRAFDP